MQRLLEQKTPLGKGHGSFSSSSQHRLHLPLVLLCIGIAAYIALFLLPYAATDDPPSGHPPSVVPPVPPINIRNAKKHEASSDSGDSNNNSGGGARVAPDKLVKQGEEIEAEVRPGEVPSLHPWGYNKDRNLARWKALYASIASDRRRPFTLIDYGADQGYFSISVAKFFPDAFVMGLELGGCGGEIWKKHCDVLLIQEEQLRERHVNNMRICQTKMHPSHFAALAKASMLQDYQFVLSVFHWFDLKDRNEFEVALVDLLRNAKTTFIELPTIGDDGPIIRKQVNYEGFKKWYDGRKDVGKIISDAASRFNFRVNVTLLVSLPWAQKYTRDVYRVDQLELGDLNVPVERSKFMCSARREIYKCNTARQHFNSCPEGI